MSKFLNISTDNTLGGNAPDDATVVSQKAIKEYVDSKTGTGGDNIANWSTNVSNCIVEIPQDINLTLSNGTLTLKSGSKVYVPNGAGVFDVVTISGDKTHQQSANGQITVYYSPSQNSIKSYYSSADMSGTTAPTTYGTWYDTANNLISRYDSGTVTLSGLSFPIARVTVSNGAISSIDQIFNGFGYIGSTMFALPGVKVKTANGRNSDGTLFGNYGTISSVQTYTASSARNGKIIISNTGSMTWAIDYSYDERTNRIYNYGLQNAACVGICNTGTGGVITNFQIFYPFRAVDYSDVYSKTEIDNNVVHKAGSETITGAKSFTALPQMLITTTTTAATYQDVFVQKDSNLDTTTNPTYNKSYYLSIKDKNNKYLGYISNALNTAGSSTMTMYARTRNTGNTGDVTAGISVTAKRDGTYSTYVPSPTEATTTSSQIDTVGARQTAILSKISNCVTEIPQDIKLTLSNGTLTLKAGSKVYKPDGTYVTIDSDVSTTSGINGTALVAVHANGSALYFQYPANCVSGTTDSKAGETYHWWFDTTNNVINRYTSDGTTPSQTLALPIAIVTTTSGTITSIDQVFNGFGYIGSTTFALPGVSVLAPDGRNTNGTLKTYAYTVSSVMRRTDTANGTYLIAINCNNGTFGVGQYVYDETTNYNYVNNAVSDKRCIVASAVATGGKVTNLTVKTPFHAVDYNDYSALDNNVVHKTGTESIAGAKTFTDAVNTTSQYRVTNTQNAYARYMAGGIEFSPLSTAGNGGFIDFHFNGSTDDYTSRIMESWTGELSYVGAQRFTATNSTSSGVIATKGWVNNAATATNVVHRTDSENIAGQKTFTANPVIYQNNPMLMIQDANNTKGTAPTNTTWQWFAAIYDSAGRDQANKLAQIYHTMYNTGATSLNFQLFKPEAGSSVSASEFALNSDGTMTIPQPRAATDSTTSNQADTVGARNTRINEFFAASYDNTTITANASNKLQASGLVNKNSASGATATLFDWVGTLAEYEAQDVATNHPEWVCYITDDCEATEYEAYTKSQTDNLLAGKVNAGHELVAYQEPTSDNNYVWYRKYADGWVEQGGLYIDNSGSGTTEFNVVFPIPMADNTYITNAFTDKIDYTSVSPNYPLFCSGLTTTGMVLKAAWRGVSLRYHWQVCGKAAN